MHAASLELCKELYEVSNWRGLDYIWCPEFHSGSWNVIYNPSPSLIGTYPAYDLGYLLRKLPAIIRPNDTLYTFYISKLNNDTFMADYWRVQDGFNVPYYGNINIGATEPENSACKLLIELFKQGILNRAPLNKRTSLL